MTDYRGITCDVQYLAGAIFWHFSFFSHGAGLSLPYKNKNHPKDYWLVENGCFIFPDWKNPQIVTAKSAFWVTELVSGCDKCFSFWTCQKKMNLHCTTGHLGCWASVLCLNMPQAFHQPQMRSTGFKSAANACWQHPPAAVLELQLCCLLLEAGASSTLVSLRTEHR